MKKITKNTNRILAFVLSFSMIGFAFFVAGPGVAKGEADSAGSGSLRVASVGSSFVYLPLIANMNYSVYQQAPYIPSNPTPDDAAPDQPVDISLSWSGGDPNGDPVTYDIHLGLDDTNLAPVDTNLGDTTYHPGALQDELTYYWQVVARDSYGEISAGPIWSFETGDENPQATERILVAESGANRVAEFDKTSGILMWSVATNGALCAYRLENGNTLICEYDRVIEVNPAGTTVWAIAGLPLPYDTQRLENGNTLVALGDAGKIVEYAPDGTKEWSYGTALERPYQVIRLENDTTMVVDGTVVARVIHPNRTVIGADGLLSFGYSVDRLPNGHFLFGEIDRVEEYDFFGNLVWTVLNLNRVDDVQRLANGNTLITIGVDNAIYEIDPLGTVVWSMVGLLDPWSATQFTP